MNTKQHDSCTDELFVILQTVINHGRYELSGNDTERNSFLNKRGEFRAVGTPELPIFTWNDRQSAEAAAAIVTRKKLFLAKVFMINESFRHKITYFIEFSELIEDHVFALTNYLNSKPFEDAKSQRLNKEKVYKKILFYASKILELADATSDEMLVIQKRLTSENPGWSILSSARSLLGKKSMDMIECIRRREIKMSPDLTIDQLEQAIAIANKFISNKN